MVMKAHHMLKAVVEFAIRNNIVFKNLILQEKIFKIQMLMFWFGPLQGNSSKALENVHFYQDCSSCSSTTFHYINFNFPGGAFYSPKELDVIMQR